jgi:hypothetical protein
MLDAMITWATDLVHHAALHDLVLSAPTPTPSGGGGGGGGIPVPQDGVRPPGADEFQTLLGWVKWGALFCCVGGFLIIGARMGIQHKRGEGGGHMGSLAIASAACIVVASAVLFVQQLAGT